MAGQRERDRYGRRSWGEALSEIPGSLRAHPGATLVASALVGMWAVWLLLRPTYVTIEQIGAGDCLYIRPEVAAPANPLGETPSAGGNPRRDVSAFAELAPCQGTHSHEILWVTTLGDPDGVLPQPTDLTEQHTACRDSLLERLGGVEDAALEASVLVPSAADWDAGARSGACAVFRVDRGLLDRPVGAGT